MSQLSTANVALKKALYIGQDSDLMEAVRVSIMSKYELEAIDDVPHVLPEELDLVFVEFDGDAKETLDKVNRLLTLGKGVPVYVLLKQKDADFIIEASHHGVQGFIECPNEVFHILSILHMQDRRRQGKNGIVSSLFSLKGGVGCTALASNIASHIAEMTDGRTVLVDLNMPLGDTALYLNMEEKRLYTITDFIYNINRFDENLVYKSLSRHESGLYILPLPSDIGELDVLTADKIKLIIDSLRKYFDHVVIDMASDLSEASLSCLDESDNIVLVAEPSLSAIRAVNSVISLTQRLGYLKETLKLIMNRNTSVHDEVMEELIENLEVDRIARVDNDYFGFNNSLKEGVLLAQYKPESSVNMQLRCIANMLHNGSVQLDATPEPQLKRSWFERLKMKLLGKKEMKSFKPQPPKKKKPEQASSAVGSESDQSLQQKVVA
jgi:pilus assembly protein CpaE